MSSEDLDVLLSAPMGTRPSTLGLGPTTSRLAARPSAAGPRPSMLPSAAPTTSAPAAAPKKLPPKGHSPLRDALDESLDDLDLEDLGI